jgi:hypothetical protein
MCPIRCARRPAAQGIFALVIVWISCFGVPTAGQAQPREVGVGVQVRQIQSVDQKAENFGIVGILRLEWDDPKLAFDPRKSGREFKVFDQPEFRKLANENGLFYPGFIISNQQGRRFSQGAAVVVLPGGHATYLEEFSAVLQAPDFDFAQFPFDEQKFFIRIVSNPPESFVKYVPLEAYSGFGEQLGEEEWFLTKHCITVDTTVGATGLPSSRFSFGFAMRRHLNYYFLRIFLPLAVFVAVSWATFFLEEFEKRIDVAAANLLIFVVFNFAISGDLPRIGYLTFLDFILFAMFIITAMIIIFNIALRRLMIKGREDLARRIDNYALKWIYPLAYVAVISWAVYAFQYRPSLALAG